MNKFLLIVLLIFVLIFFSLSMVYAATWAPNTYYAVNTIVAYNRVSYTCIQAHTSQEGWEPSKVPALWKANEPSISAVTPTSTKTPLNGVTPVPNKTGDTLFSAAPPSGWGNHIFAPYVDITLYPTFNINNCYNKTGQKYYVLAFITANGNGEPAWGGIITLDQNFYMDQINSIRRNGGNVIVSFGGAEGTELANSFANSTVSSVQSKYQAVINKYKFNYIGFDIEGGALSNRTTIDLRNKAIKGLQLANPGLTVAYCLPVLPSGLTMDGLYALTNAKANGVRIDVVNIMAMDYGDGQAPNPDGKMGDYAIRAAQSTYTQCGNNGISAKIGVTPMIGRNYSATEIFYTADAQKLLTWAQSTSWMRFISMWSVNRDNGGCGAQSWASPTCSSIAQAEFAFTNIFKAYK